MISKKTLPYFQEDNNLLGLPQEYKGIKLHPVKIFELDIVKIINMIFGRSKEEYINSAIDIKIQKRLYKISYMKTLMTILQMQINPNGIDVTESLKLLLSIITKTEYDKIKIFLMGDKQFLLANDLLYDNSKIVFTIDEIAFNENDFDIIREIILEQNGISVSYIDGYHPELEIALQQEISNTRSDITFSDDIFSFVSLLQKTIQDISNYTLFQFKKQYERLRMIEDFRALYPLEASGKIKAKDGIPYYNKHIKDKGRYDSILVDMEDFKENDIFKGIKAK